MTVPLGSPRNLNFYLVSRDLFCGHPQAGSNTYTCWWVFLFVVPVRGYLPPCETAQQSRLIMWYTSLHVTIKSKRIVACWYQDLSTSILSTIISDLRTIVKHTGKVAYNTRLDKADWVSGLWDLNRPVAVSYSYLVGHGWGDNAAMTYKMLLPREQTLGSEP